MNLALGRELSPEEDRIGDRPAVVLSNRLWRERFAGSPTALGKTVTLNGVDYTIVGVLRPGFQFNQQEADVYTALGRGDPLFLTDRANHDIVCLARLRPEVTADQARAEMNVVQDHLAQFNPETERGQGAYIVPHQFLGAPIYFWCFTDGGNCVWHLAGIEKFEHGPAIGT